MRACMRASMRASVHACTCLHLCTCMHVCVRARMRAILLHACKLYAGCEQEEDEIGCTHALRPCAGLGTMNPAPTAAAHAQQTARMHRQCTPPQHSQCTQLLRCSSTRETLQCARGSCCWLPHPWGSMQPKHPSTIFPSARPPPTRLCVLARLSNHTSTNGRAP